jgi:hypothetical protein
MAARAARNAVHVGNKKRACETDPLLIVGCAVRTM